MRASFVGKASCKEGIQEPYPLPPNVRPHHGSRYDDTHSTPPFFTVTVAVT